jgi:hypothetical protein
MSKLTKEQLFFRKLKLDFPWYSENFLKIRDKKANIVDFKLNKAQRIVHDKIIELRRENRPVRVLFLKARQMGLSTFTEGFIFHDTSTNENKNALIIAHEETASANLFNMSKLYYEYLPELIRPMKKYANGKVLQFENPTPDENEKQKNPGLLRSKILSLLPVQAKLDVRVRYTICTCQNWRSSLTRRLPCWGLCSVYLTRKTRM